VRAIINVAARCRLCNDCKRIVDKPYLTRLGKSSRHPANGASVGPDRAEHEAVSSTSFIAPTPTGRRIRRLRWNDGQDNLGGMLCIQVDRVVRDLRAAVIVERFSRVWVAVEAGR
jgi:hypothetical protein